jgi:hypothetical protein
METMLVYKKLGVSRLLAKMYMKYCGTDEFVDKYISVYSYLRILNHRGLKYE